MNSGIMHHPSGFFHQGFSRAFALVALPVLLAATMPKDSQAGDDPAPEKDRQAILAMAGEYEVLFNFTEYVSLQEGYELKPPYTEDATELVLVVEDAGHRIVLQHLLSVGDRVVKHWKQIWSWQDTELTEFQGNNTWKIRRIGEEEAKGTWTQLVAQVDDSPRYESYGRWEHDGGFSRWESQSTARPLPRREHTKRDDYEILQGVNLHALTPTGWLHEQHNWKRVIDEKGETVRYIAGERGENVYNHIDDTDFSSARQYWAATSQFWASVSALWDELSQERGGLVIVEKVEDKTLPSILNEQAKALVEGTGKAPSVEELRRLIQSYLK